MKNQIMTVLMPVFLFLSLGCDKVCYNTVEDFATVQNTTGRTLNLNVCKGSLYGEALATIPADTMNNEINLGRHQTSEVKGGMDSVTRSCSNSTSRTATAISLSPASYSDVKLCRNHDTNHFVVVETYQTCPTGYAEQTSTGPCDMTY